MLMQRLAKRVWVLHGKPLEKCLAPMITNRGSFHKIFGGMLLGKPMKSSAQLELEGMSVDVCLCCLDWLVDIKIVLLLFFLFWYITVPNIKLCSLLWLIKNLPWLYHDIKVLFLLNIDNATMCGKIRCGYVQCNSS